MNFEEKLVKFIISNNIKAEHLRFEQSIHTVEECVNITGFPIEEITKSVVMTLENKCILGLVPAKFRVSTSRAGKLLNLQRPNVANKETTLELTGYPIGGVPFIGFHAKRLVDPKIMELEYIYTGGGSDRSLLKLWTSEIKKFDPIIARIRK